MADIGGLRVIGAGFGRTGTLSLKAALETLGFGPCYHMVEVFAHPEHAPMWRAAAGQPVDWHRLFAGYRATVDWPACAFYAQLMDAFPDARVILTVRDPERWYESARATIYRMRNPGGGASGAAMRAMFMLGRLLVPRLRTTPDMINEVIWQGTFEDRFEDRERAIAVYQQHNEEVKRRVPPDKLLVYQVGQGWEPLCAFLGVDVPADTPFPHLNDRASFGPRTMRRVLAQRQRATVAQRVP